MSAFKAPPHTEKKNIFHRDVLTTLVFTTRYKQFGKKYLERLLYQNRVILKSNALPDRIHRTCKIYVAIIFTSFFYGSVNTHTHSITLAYSSFVYPSLQQPNLQ